MTYSTPYYDNQNIVHIMLHFVLESILMVELQSPVSNYDHFIRSLRESLKASSNHGITCALQYGSKSVHVEFEWKWRWIDGWIDR